jgi:hypothetical protein
MEMETKTSRIVGAAAVAALAGLLTASMARAEEPIGGRKVRQQDRIAQGIRSGQLTPRETAGLERKEGALNREEHNMRTLDGGRLTQQDRRVIDRQQNRLSRGIYSQKHDAQHS